MGVCDARLKWGDRVRILQVHNQYREPGGEDRVVQVESELLRSSGHQVIAHRVTNPASAVQSAGLLLLSPRNPGAARAVRHLAEKFQPDVAHVHNTWFSLSPSVLGALHDTGVPVVVTLHNYRIMCVNGLLFREGRPCERCVASHPWHGVRFRCYRGSAMASTVAATGISFNRARNTWLRDVSRFLVLSDFSRQRFVTAGLPDGRITVVSNFVDDPGPRSVRVTDSRNVLFVGRLSFEKGVDVLLDAWAGIGDTKMELQVVGDGPLRGELEGRAGPGVRFLGHRPLSEVRRLMSEARALAFPSLTYENQPMVLLEAMSAGLPVIASRLGAIPEVFSGVSEFGLVAPGDVAAWRSALRRLADRSLAESEGSLMRALYEERYTPATARARLESVYYEVAKASLK